MTIDHEQLVLDAAAAILRARGEHERADAVAGGLASRRRGRVSAWEPGPEATVLQRRVWDRMRTMGSNQFRLASDVGLGRDAVRDILRGKVRSPGAVSLSKLAKGLGTSIDYLIGETDEP